MVRYPLHSPVRCTIPLLHTPGQRPLCTAQPFPALHPRSTHQRDDISHVRIKMLSYLLCSEPCRSERPASRPLASLRCPRQVAVRTVQNVLHPVRLL